MQDSRGDKSGQGPLGEEIEFFCEGHMNEVKNPWEEIDLDNYEKHMSLGSVMQLQTINSMMKDQFDAYPVETVMILGIAGGNGLEYVDTEKFKKVYGVDINEEYLKVVSERYAELSGVLECLHGISMLSMDLTGFIIRWMEKR